MSDDSTRFRFGRRIHVTQNVTAQPSYDVRPLQRTDFLNPVEGDDFNHKDHHGEEAGDRHAAEVTRLATLLRHHYRYNPSTSVVESAIVRWPDADLAAPMPDISVVSDLSNAKRRITTLDLGATEARVRAIFEVTSPLFASLDLEEKVEIYRQAGVPEYWIIDTGLRPDHDQPAYNISAWRLHNDVYVPITPGEQGRYHSEICRVWLRVTPDQSFEVGDIRTGELIAPGDDADARAATAQAEANARAQSIADQLNL